MLKIYPTKWEIVDEATGKIVAKVKAFDEEGLKISIDNQILESSEIEEIAILFEEAKRQYLNEKTSNDVVDEQFNQQERMKF